MDSPGPDYVQDEDVLDTWFSSWLWPFATLGWPDDTDALKAFYPGSVLVSGYDILFFWIARMIMAGTHFLGEAPFTDVFITGMIKDKQGRWMSKSLGNGIDPLDMIEQYGADGVRFTLAKLCAQGQDIRWTRRRSRAAGTSATRSGTPSTCSAGSWRRATTAAPPTTQGRSGADRKPAGRTACLVERWLDARLDETVRSVSASLDAYRVSEAAQTAYDFVWRDFCDWYLELAKPAHGEAMDEATLAFSVRVFDQILRLLHPFMPFLTEELWWKLRPHEPGDALIAASWPEGGAEDPDAVALFETVQALVVAVRQVRAQYNVPPSKAIDARIRVGGEDAAATVAALESARGDLERLGGVGGLQIGADQEKPPASVAVVVDRHEVFVPLAGMIDLDVERDRLRKEIDAKRGFLGGVEKKLRNEQFTSRAPEAVVAKERQKADDARAEIAALEANLADLG